jgi:uncharacterized protein YjcR
MIDWEAIKSEYITGEASQAELAKKFGVSRSIIGDHCRKEKWVEERDKYRRSVVQKTIDARAREDSAQLLKLMDAASRITGIALDALADDSVLYTYMVERREKYEVPVGADSGVPWMDGDPDVPVIERQWSEDQESKALNTRALKDLSNIIKDMTGLIRDFYDIPTPAQREQQRIAAERLELERRKADQTEASGNITIIVPKDAEGLDE